jgi:hypothetical protein
MYPQPPLAPPRPVLVQRPDFGTNYGPGFTGLVSRRRDWVSAGIDWFTRWDALKDDPRVSHAFVVVGEDATVEAFGDGVKPGTLTAYLSDPDVALLVKRPFRYSDLRGVGLTTTALAMVGERLHYNYLLIGALAVQGTWLGHLLDKATKGWFGDTAAELAEQKRGAICSEVVGRVMRPVYGAAGMLIRPDPAITPQLILSDCSCYEGPVVELAASIV